MRNAYHEQLSALGEQLGEMCGLAADAMEHATDALLQADLAMAEQVFADYDRIAALSKRAEHGALKLLALQQPVARDLREIVGSIHIAADIDRMGGLALHVAKIARRRHPANAVPDEVRACFAEMGSKAVQLARTAQDVLLSRDPVRAAHLRDEDDAVDTQHQHLFTVMMDRNWTSGVCAAVDVALLGRFYERFADHAVEIGRRVVFEATGGLPRQSAG
ncbi:phosphate signaling complex protein PhoU [Mycobacterium hubeiense]|uniref:phosphate signaling complex protein PhoU n=1 Tax=Mycobacterium hubeiense TaxID=1867256 RepID=UPI000C7E9B6D|nr:phosphate signaling complex protein PhoU [Mycobacterium sp. QGD 101]